MSDHADATVDDAAKKPSFMDLFAVHLAARLVGRENLLKQLVVEPSDEPLNSRKDTFRVYWRTPLLCDTDMTSLLSSSEAVDDWNMVFVDVTVVGDRFRRELTTVVGMMLQQGKECVYLIAKPLKYSQLSSHCESIGIDIECTPPDAIAHTMGSAMMGIVVRTLKLQGTGGGIISTIKDVSNVDCVRLPVSLYYKDLQETGTLEMPSKPELVFPERGAAMMLSNIESKDEQAANDKKDPTETTNAVHDTQLASDLTKAFEIWWNVPNPNLGEAAVASTEATVASTESTVEATGQGETLEEVSNPPAKEQTGVENVANGTAHSSAASKIPISMETTMNTPTSEVPPAAAAPDANEEEKKEEPKKPQVKRPQAGYVRVQNSKRKRRGKLTFAKASK